MKKEIIKSFDLASYKNGAKVKTREGHEVRIICTDAERPSYPVVALVKVDDNRECIMSYTPEGKEYYSSADSDPNDLVIVEEVEESNPSDEGLQNWVNDNVPELKWSADERIRKELIGFLRNIPNHNYTCEEMALWLEKQGIRPRYNIGDVICDKSCTTLNKEAQPNMEIVDIQNGMYICDKGSFPVSQQDEYELVSKKIDTKLNDNSVSNELREASFAHARKELKNPTCPDNEELELVYTFEEGAKWQAARKSSWSKDDDDNIGMIGIRLIDLLSYTRGDNSLTKHRKNTIEEEVVGYENWLTSLKDRVQPQPKQEWSEDGWTMQDEEELEIALDTLVKAGQHSSAKWLKNVCLIPQNTWKPSNAQMIALNDVITNGHLSNANERILKGLQEQLKKLK